MNDSTITYSQRFSGKRLLILEDEYFLTEETRRILRNLGTVLIGPFSNLAHARELIEGGQVDAAILDMYLDAAAVFPVVETLEKASLPYVFAIGQAPTHIAAGFAGFILSEKAIEIEHIAAALFGRQKRDI